MGSFLEAVARLCHVQVSDLGVKELYEIPAQERIVENFILNRALLSGGTSISDDFMLFMSEWGQNCVNRHLETGELLMEIAMQRISKGAVPHAPYDLKNALPEQYRQYSAADDEDREMSSACWCFIRNNINYCLKLQNQTWRKHAQLILLGLIQHLNEDGSTNDGYQWDEQRIGVSVKDAYSLVMRVCGVMLSFMVVVEVLAPHWRQNRRYFKFMEDVIDWSDKSVRQFFAHDEGVDRDGYPYFSKKTKFFLKIFGLYQSALIAKIRQDMRMLR